MIAFQFTCRRCGWCEVADRDGAVAKLRLLGVLRRERQPEDSLIAELLPDAVSRMTCPVCKQRGVLATPADDDIDSCDWQAAVLCEVCRQPIPVERLDALPAARRCVVCQDAVEQGQPVDEEPEFCPKCGALIEIRVGRGAGITRYKRFCTGDPPCRLEGT